MHYKIGSTTISCFVRISSKDICCVNFVKMDYSSRNRGIRLIINHKGSNVGTTADTDWHLYTFTFETVDAKLYYKFYLDGVILFTLNVTDYSSSDHFDTRSQISNLSEESVIMINIGRNLNIGNFDFYWWKFFMTDSVLTDQDIQLYYNQRVNNT